MKTPNTGTPKPVVESCSTPASFTCARAAASVLKFAGSARPEVMMRGIGSSPEGLERLCSPFSQIDITLARKFEGTGLGLAMVKLLAELRGGTVAVESAVGEGSCFTVWALIALAMKGDEERIRAAGCEGYIREANGRQGFF